MEEQEEQTEEIKQPGVMFDAQLVELFRPTIVEAFSAHTDVLRSVVISFDYYGQLNDADGVGKGIWLGAEGQQTDPAGIIGSAGVTLQAAATILDRGFQLLQGVRTELENTFKELTERKQELEKVKAELGHIRDAGGADPSASDTAG